MGVLDRYKTPKAGSGGPLSKYKASIDEVQEGDSPLRPIDAMPPDEDLPARIGAMSFTASSEHAAREIAKKGFDVHEAGNYDFNIRSKKDGKWYRLDPKSFGLGEMVRDVGDVAGGITNTVAQVIGGGLGAAGGAALGTPAAPGVGTVALGIAGGAAGAGAGGAAEEAARVGLGGKLFGFDPTGAEVGEAALREGLWGAVTQAAMPVAGAAARGLGRAGAATAGAAGKLLRQPLRIYKGVTGEAAREALRVKRGELARDIQKVQAATQPAIAARAGAKAALEEGKLQAEGEAQERVTKLLKEMAARNPTATTEPGFAPPAKPELTPGQAGIVTPPEDAGISFLVDALHPAWGVMAKNLPPEFKEILRRNFGQEILPALGSESMSNRASYLSRLAEQKPRADIEKAVQGYYKDLSTWLLSSDHFKGAMTENATEAAKRLLAGKGSPADRDVVDQLLGSAMKGSARPEYLKNLLRAYRETAPGAARSAATRSAAASGFKSRRAAIAEEALLNPPPDVPGFLLGGIRDLTRGLDFAGRAVEWLASKGPEQVAVLAGKAPPSVKRQLQKVILASRRGPEAYRKALKAAMANAAVRAFIESQEAEGSREG